MLPFLTQYKPSVSTLKESFNEKNGILNKTNRCFAKFLKILPPIIFSKKGKSLKDMLDRGKI